MPEIKLSGGNSAVVKEIEDMTRGDVRAAFKLADLDGAGATGGELGMNTVGALQDAVMVQFILSWTLTDGDGRVLPINMKSIKSLRLRDYNPLMIAAQPALQEVMSNTDSSVDPTSTEPSSASDDTEPESS